VVHLLPESVVAQAPEASFASTTGNFAVAALGAASLKVAVVVLAVAG
jgi:hypothetical protein